MNLDVIRNSPGVQRAVRQARDRIAAEGRAKLAAHRDLAPHHSITTEAHPEGAAVYLEGEASRAVEFGHFTPSGRKWVEGMHFITGGRK
ncbi:DUF5403 family protein [Calidifontibacter indicus]|uniref:DUF5403 family protein n=1 Tax=Calidifontibacter indicus TaxID=419650 RepID=UPI003D730467